MNRHSLIHLEVVVAVFLALIALMLFAEAKAARAAAPGPLASIPIEGGTPGPGPAGPTPTSAPSGSPAPHANPVQTILNVISFDATGSLLSAWTQVLASAQQKSAREMLPALEAAARRAAGDFLRFSAKGLEGIDTGVSQGSFLAAVRDLWSRVFTVAVLLFPLAVLMNLAAVLVSGVSAPVARSEMLEALVRSLLALGISAGSFLITGSMIKIAWGAAQAVADAPAAGNGSYVESLLLGLASGILSTNALTSMLSIFITLTIVFIILLAFSALILSYYALLTLTVGMVALAPLVVVLGNLPEFHWVYATWIRAFIGVILVPLADAILFKMWSAFSLGGASLTDVLVSVGFLCILTTVNFYVGKLVFSPAVEAGKMAAGSLASAFQLGTAAVGLVAGLAGLGAIGAAVRGAGAAGALQGQGGLAGGPTGPAGGIPGGSQEGGDGRGSFGARVERWRARSSEERQAALAQVEGQTYQTRARGQIAQALAGRDPLLRAAAGAWTTAREAGLAGERSAIRAASDEVSQARGAGSAPAAWGRGQGAPAPSDRTRMRLAASSIPNKGLPSSPGNPGQILPPGTRGIYPALFGNPAYDERVLGAVGWGREYQQALAANVQGLSQAAQTVALRSSLPHAQVIYDPLVTRDLHVGPGTGRLTPELFQAAAVRVAAGWLSQPAVTQNLAGAHLLERGEAEQVLSEVGRALSREPIGRLAEAILAAGREGAPRQTPGEFWDRVAARFTR